MKPKIRNADCSTWTSPTHPEISVYWNPVDKQNFGEAQRFCGDNYCTGTCGLPALIIPWEPVPSIGSMDRFSKASGSQVACGRVFQGKRVEWKGARVEVPPEYREDFEKRIWF